MAIERQIELSWRAWANAQRRARETFLEQLSGPLHADVERAVCIYSPDADSWLRKIFPCSATQVGVTPADELPRFRFIETGWYSKAMSVLESLALPNETGELVVLAQDFSTVSLHGTIHLVPELPLFRLPMKAARELMISCVRPESALAAGFAPDLSVGALIEASATHCDKDPGPQERTYEVAVWGEWCTGAA